TAHRVAAEGAYRQALATGPTSEVTTSTLVLRQQLATLEAEYQQKRTFMKPEHPEMQSLKAQIDELSKQIAGTSAQMASGRTNSLLVDYRAALSAERALQARVNQIKCAVLTLRGRSIQYNILQREVDTNRQLYDALLQRYKEIGVAGGVGVNNVAVVDPAQVPLGPSSPKLILNLLLSLVLGSVLGAGLALALDQVDEAISDPTDVERVIG